MAARLSIELVRKTFRGRPVLKGASVWSEAGKVTLLLGRNGCGKSTLLRCGVGLKRWNEGGVFVDGKHVAPDLPSLALLGVFYWPDAGLLSRRRTIGWHLQGVRKGAAVDASNAPEYCAAFLDRRPDELSGGERQRCEMTIVEEAKPRFLITDEPLASVEPRERAGICDRLRRLARGGAAVLVTGHEVDDLLDLADDVVWMVAGTTHHLGTTAVARAHFQFRKDYLGSRAASAS
jgi:lipopolysaccharide export system ATP-binding protein